MSSLADLNQIYEQSRRLTSHIVAPGNIPSLDRGLDQIAAATKKLSAKSSRTGDASFRALTSRTAYLLANRGFDADRVSAALSMLDPAATFEPVEGLYDTDIEGYLKQEHENMILSAIENSRSQTLKDCNDRFNRTLHRDWEKAKKRIFEELGQHQQKSSQRGYRSPARPIGRSGSSIPGPVTGGQSFSVTKNKNYSQVVETLNKSRLERKPFEPIQAFFAVALKLDRGDVGHQSLMKCWKLLYKTLIEQGLQPSGGGPRKKQIKELEFAKAYRAQEDGKSLTEEAIHFRKMVIAGGKSFLEENHYEHIQHIVSQQRAQVGGMPTPNIIIDFFIELKFMRFGNWQPQHGLEIIQNRAAWAHLYYLLRCGLKEDAKQYAEDFSSIMDKSPDARFFPIFREYLEENGRISTAHRNELNDAWNARVRQSLSLDSSGRPRGDPFKAALYKIVGRCEMTSKGLKNNDVLPTMRIIFALKTATLTFTSSCYRHIISVEAFAVEAIHFAIALSYYGVLRVPDSPHTMDIGYETFERMIHQYAKQFFQTDPIDALHYLALTCIFVRDTDRRALSGSAAVDRDDAGGASERARTKAYLEITYAHMRELLLESGISSKLLGETSIASAVPARGEIERLGPLYKIEQKREFLEKIVLPAAEDADRRGRLNEQVVTILCKQLGDALAAQRLPSELADPYAPSASGTPGGGLSFTGIAGSAGAATITGTTEAIVAKAMNPTIQAKIGEERRYTSNLLSQLHKFAKEVEAGRPDAGLETLKGPDMGLITRYADIVRSLDESIARCLPQVLLLAMTTVSGLYRALRDGRYGGESPGFVGNGVRQSRMMELKSHSRAILLFSGSIQYRIPSDTLQRLNRLDALMN
ncbi:Nup93/Nic96-domain-containing protein [Chytridium lagenaria]|nr:Nup93/Nic96-domain-containing protein [Chytridium lagenaria]